MTDENDSKFDCSIAEYLPYIAFMIMSAVFTTIIYLFFRTQL